jgi:hypothetical protein
MSTKKYLVLSVEHSGTRFVKNHLLRGHERSYYHLRPHYQDFLRTVVEKYQFVFVPLRHPLEIARSWSKRGMSLEMLATPLFVTISSKSPDAESALTWILGNGL